MIATFQIATRSRSNTRSKVTTTLTLSLLTPAGTRYWFRMNMINLEQRRAGLLYGAFVAEALALGVHWIYDTNEIERRGRASGYTAPGKDSYHPNKQAGEPGPVGDQALWLLDFLRQNSKWDADAFMADWASRWASYDDYVDGATTTTLQNLENGQPRLEAASASDELAGPARGTPLIVQLATGSEEDVVKATLEQNNLTHRSPAAAEATEFLARASHRLLHDATLDEVIRDTAPAWAIKAAEGVQGLGAVEAIGRLGQSCSASAALPGVIFLALKYGTDTDSAFVENAMAGGDSCARALVLGALLGAAHGLDSIREEWRRDLCAAPRIDAFLNC
jgi:ADP-ribosylglycohydrolase